MTASNAPLTNSIMNLAAKGAEGSAAAFRGASANLGAAIGVVIMSTLVFGTFQSSLSTQLQSSGGDPADAAAISQSLRDDVSSENVAAQYSVPMSEVETIDDAQRIALVDAYRTQGAVGGAVVLVAALIFAVHRSRPSRS